MYERRRNAREFPSRNVKKIVGCFFLFYFFFPQNMEGFCLYWSRFTAMVWSSGQCLEHTECSQIGWVHGTPCQHLHSFTAAFWGQDPPVFQGSKKRLGIPSLPRWCGLQRAVTLGCTSINVRIQCIQAGDFTTNSERRQSTKGVQAWSWAVARSISENTKRWREYYFCFQGALFGCILFSLAV